jgi:hypothetical protein
VGGFPVVEVSFFVQYASRVLGVDPDPDVMRKMRSTRDRG